jgi:periplasmic copper chaperone A
VRRALPRTTRPLAARASVPAAVLALTLGLTGCGAGFEAQTYQTRLVADGTNAAVGAIAIRNATIQPEDDGTLSAGDDAEVAMWLTNDGGEDDRLVGAESPDASSVEILDKDSGEPVSSVDLPRLGTTGLQYGVALRSLAEDRRAGQFIELTLRFERNGEITMLVPIATLEEFDQDRERSDNFHPPGDDEGDHGGDAGARGDGEGDRSDTTTDQSDEQG